MISKKNLKGKYVTYKDKDAKFRTEQVIRISGSWLTVVNAYRIRHRVHRDRVLGRQFPKKGLEDIQW